ncbi:MAG: DUF1207 domain-containing protein [Planctomycetota bacterium]|nr:DUF1207 domain-containing protein [Planctomycetota bacterium]
MNVKLKVLHGARAGKELGIPTPECLVGRSQDCHLQPKSEAISRHHCVVYVRDGRVFVRDLNQHKHRESDHGNDRGHAGHNSRVVHGILLRAVCAAMLFGVLNAVLAGAWETVPLPSAQRYPELAEDRGSGNQSVAAWNERPAAAAWTRPTMFTNDPEQRPSFSAETPQGVPASDGLERWSPPRPNAVQTDPWVWQVLPDGLIYPSYLAGPKEPRFASIWNYDQKLGWMLDLEAGGRVALLRYGTAGVPRPDGWELDLEGAAFPRLDVERNEDMISTDFRVGLPLTFGYGSWRAKLEAYHLSSHLGDELMLRLPETPRINYSRNAFVFGGAYYPTDDLRLYAEVEWAFDTAGGTRPWEFQFGVDYSPVCSSGGLRGTPFLALNCQLREETEYEAAFVAQVGWQWRGLTGHLFRLGVQYFTGPSDQYQFFCRNENKVGIGLWYDF